MKDYNIMTIEELTKEYNELYAEIQNEKLWAFGAQDEWEANLHMDNVDHLRMELQHIITLVNQKQGRIGDEQYDY